MKSSLKHVAIRIFLFAIWYTLIWFLAYSSTMKFYSVGENIVNFGWLAKIILLLVVFGKITYESNSLKFSFGRVN